MLEAAEPVFEMLPGWRSPTPGIREWGALPDAASGYVERIGELAGVKVGLVSTSPDREDTIVRSSSPLASWFA